jgi:tetratricopeptide (TPR) repeat protein
MERLVEAVDDYDKLLEQDEDSLTGLSGRGQVYAEMGEFEQALEDLNRAVELCSQGGPPYLRALTLDGRALANAGLGRQEEADEDFEASIALCPDNAWVHYYRGLVHHQRGDAAAAADCFRRALESAKPSLPPRKRERARGYLRRQDEKAAGKALGEPGTA